MTPARMAAAALLVAAVLPALPTAFAAAACGALALRRMP